MFSNLNLFPNPNWVCVQGDCLGVRGVYVRQGVMSNVNFNSVAARGS